MTNGNPIAESISLLVKLSKGHSKHVPSSFYEPWLLTRDHKIELNFINHAWSHLSTGLMYALKHNEGA